MKTLYLENQNEVVLQLYPDNQPHVNIAGIKEGDGVQLICRIESAVHLIWLLEASNALDNLFARKQELVILYLLAARSDRIMQPGDSVDLQVVADLINYCGFEKVKLVDVHSDVALRLIKRSVNIDNSFLVKKYSLENAVLIIPDAGAAKKAGKYFEWNKNLTETVDCIKSRDLSNGKISLKVLEPEKCKDRNCVIIDDLVDGGATFLAIAQQIQAKHLTLIVTHGLFLKGIKELEKYFDLIITSDTVRHGRESKKLMTVNVEI